MAEIETEKKPAKIWLREIQDRASREAFEAKERGEKVGWCASNFPQEIPTAMGLHVCYPESMGAGVAAKGGGARMCSYSEDNGYSNDLCSYSRINLAFADLKECEELSIPMPDFLLCCTNICNCLMKWYENLSEKLEIPMLLIDIPQMTHDDSEPERIQYIKDQFEDCIHQLEEITGKKMDYDKLDEVMKRSVEGSRYWYKANTYMSCVPSPFSGFDIFNNMAVPTVARGDAESVEAFKQLCEEYDENARNHTTTFKGEEKYRIMFEGIATFGNLSAVYKGLKNRGINMTATPYGTAFTFIYNNLDELADQYSKVPTCNTFEKELEMRLNACRNNKVDGAIIHMNRSCKRWSGFAYELERRLRSELGIPVMFFDGDQSDPRVFNQAQFETRLDALVEIMEENKRKKEAEQNA